jgi:hypothetical protein
VSAVVIIKLILKKLRKGEIFRYLLLRSSLHTRNSHGERHRGRRVPVYVNVATGHVCVADDEGWARGRRTSRRARPIHSVRPVTTRMHTQSTDISTAYSKVRVSCSLRYQVGSVKVTTAPAALVASAVRSPGLFASTAAVVSEPHGKKTGQLRISGWIDGRMNGWMDGWTDGWMDGWMNE